MRRRKEVTVDGTGDGLGGRSLQRLEPVANESTGCAGGIGPRCVVELMWIGSRHDHHDGRGRELDARLGRANEQIDRLREATDRSGNVVQFRMARYLESLHELVVDLNERSRQMPLAGTYERRTFERDLGSLEDQIAVTFAEFASATAEEQGTPARRCEPTSGCSRWRRRPPRAGGDACFAGGGEHPPDPVPSGRSGPARPTGEVGREERRSEYAVRTKARSCLPSWSRVVSPLMRETRRE